MLEILGATGRWIILILEFMMAAATLASYFNHPHWALRIWDFPRLQITMVAAILAAIYMIVFFKAGWIDWLLVACLLFTLGGQIYRIYPYTPVAPSPVERSDGADASATLRIVISNVLMKNKHYDRWIKVVTRENPDLILALETDRNWEKALEHLQETFPHSIRQAQSNTYGILLFSRLPLENSEVTFIVEEDVPSIHTDILLENGERIRFHGIHPRPPDPTSDKGSLTRDAEMVRMGKKVQGKDRPRIIAGDMNDVAWSKTTKLFLELSGLLDPRLGRGFYNTFPVHYPFLRFPLDHVFHSDSFRLIELRLLESVGSDHFPVLCHLSYEPRAKRSQPSPDAAAEDKEMARERLEKARQRK